MTGVGEDDELDGLTAATGAGLIADWVYGWAVSREAGRPVAVRGGFRIEIGRPGHVRRYVLGSLDRDIIRDLVRRIDTPGVWIKAIGPEAEFRALLSPAWELAGSGHLMTTSLRRAVVRVPDGYSVQTRVERNRIVVQVLTGAGEVAAFGQTGLAGAIAVADHIGTEEAHRRRGLGGVVMGSLANAALDQGARKGVLAATAEGKALYLTLGWTFRGCLSGAWIPLPEQEQNATATG
jgi:hypothetical protein